MTDTVKAAAIIGVCLMLGLWGAGWLSKSESEIGRYSVHDGDVFDRATGDWPRGRTYRPE